jgi:type 1 glutamine amidotransferase
VHDKFGPFEIVSVDPDSSLLKNIPGRWKTKGDELYQTIALLPGSHPLLQATSPVDGRTHTVAWTHTYGTARVFATTLGHDGTTEKTPEYRQLLENAVLWAAGR